MDGYGIYCSQTNLILKNVIICHVFDRPGPFDNVIAGSGIVNSGGNISITNTIITKCARSIENRDNGNITISYSNIFGNIRHTDYVNFKNDFEDLEPFGLINKINANGDSCDAYFNISADPQFVDSSDPYFISIQPYLVYYPDLHLQKTSPCINAGTPTGAPLFDLDGTPRDALPDMGAYEYVSPVAVEESGPQEFRLLTNYPNPFNPSTTITYTLPEPAPVTLAVYSITGQKVVTLVDEAMGAGTHIVVFDGTDSPSGLYFYRLESPGYTKTGKMLLVK